MHRRRFLVGSASTAAAALLVGRVAPGYAQTSGGLAPTDHWGTPRASSLQRGRLLAHADLHNHTLFSDGDGAAQDAFASMRANNLDIACITDHTSGARLLAPVHDLGQAAGCGCGDVDAISMSDAEWDRLRELADGHDDPAGGFIAMRGFEWSASIPQTGHMNVWFSSDWTDPVATAHAGSGGASQFAGAGLAEEVGEGAPVGGELFGEAGHALAAEGGQVERDNPANVAAMEGMYRWLQQDPGTPVVGGGSDGLAGFNHPGREPGRFGHFHPHPGVMPQLVSIEVFNRREDYLFEGVDYGQPSPISQCLDAGWKVGLNGVTDEHGTDWGSPLDKGRCGLWVPEFSRVGVRQAMSERRFFATNRRGFRLDVLAEDDRTGATALMGQDFPSDGRAVRFVLDVDGNDTVVGVDEFRGRTLNVQICVTGGPMPRVVETFPIRVPDEGGQVSLPVVDLGGSPWAFVRVCDPDRGEDGRAQLPVAAAFRGVGAAIAYSSPVFLVDPGSFVPPGRGNGGGRPDDRPGARPDRPGDDPAGGGRGRGGPHHHP